MPTGQGLVNKNRVYVCIHVYMCIYLYIYIYTVSLNGPNPDYPMIWGPGQGLKQNNFSVGNTSGLNSSVGIITTCSGQGLV